MIIGKPKPKPVTLPTNEHNDLVTTTPRVSLQNKSRGNKIYNYLVSDYTNMVFLIEIAKIH